MTAAEDFLEGLELPEEAGERTSVAGIAKTWLGTPYHHRARVKGAGVDCGQLIAGVFEEAGLIDPVPLDLYPHDWMLHRSEEKFLQTIERYAKRTLRPIRQGDILLFRFGRTISHGAIVLEFPLIIHAVLRQKAVVISSYEQEEELRARLMGVWTLKGWT